MGVFARLLRRSKTTEEASAAEAGANLPETGSTAEEKTAEATDTADAGPRNTEAPEEPAEAGDPEAVDIPKQQSAGEAVDNEADKGART